MSDLHHHRPRYLLLLLTLALSLGSASSRLSAEAPPGPLVPIDVSVQADLTTNILQIDGNRATILRFDAARRWSDRGPFGPYNRWSVRAIADGPDGRTRVLWNRMDGTTGVLFVDAIGHTGAYYMPRAGWIAVDISVSSRDVTRLLWTHTDGRTMLTKIAPSGAEVGATVYGPFAGWSARSIADGIDGRTRLLWSHADGRVGLSLIDDDERIVSTSRWSPTAAWQPQDLTVGSDNMTRILLTAGAHASLWTVDADGALSSDQPVYASPRGEVALRVASASDGHTHMLWRGSNGGIVWLLDLNNVQVGFVSFADSCAGCWDY